MKVKEIRKHLLVREDGMVKDINPIPSSNTKNYWNLGSYRNGYKVISSNNTCYRIHRLVAEAFIINIDDKPFVNHLNGMKDDNQVSNLEWCTQSENVQHAHDNGLINTKSGPEHYKTSLTIKDCLSIKELLEHSNLTQTEIAKQFNTKQTIISKIKRNKHWSCRN